MARFIHGVGSQEYKDICQRLAAYYNVAEANGKIEHDRAEDVEDSVWDNDVEGEDRDWGAFALSSGDEGIMDMEEGDKSLSSTREWSEKNQKQNQKQKQKQKKANARKKRVRFAPQTSEKSRRVLTPEPRYPYEIVFRRGNLGIELEPLGSDGTGALVSLVKTGSQAHRAGIKRTDLLSFVNSTNVSNMPLLEIGVQLRKSKRPMVLRFEPLVAVYGSGSARNSL